MTKQDDLSVFCCQNKECPDYAKRGASNLTVRMRYGKDKRIRLLYCRTCKTPFSERKGTPFFQARLSDEKVLAVFEHITEGCGVRGDQSPGKGEQGYGGSLLSSCRKTLQGPS